MLALMGEMEGRISGSIPLRQRGATVLSWRHAVDDRREWDYRSAGARVLMSGCGCWPIRGLKVSTAEARAILPAQYRRQDCIAHGRHLAGFIHACYTRQPQLAAKLMKDVIAEPYRTKLLPGFSEARQAAMEMGAQACGISGSGPTLFALCDKPDTAQRVADWLGAHSSAESGRLVFIFAGWTRRAHA